MANQTQHGDHLDTESESESESLRLWFHSVDTDHSNSINVDELQVALEASNLRFPKTIVAQMIRMYDADHNGSMSFEEFTSLHNFLNTVHFAFSNVARNQQSISLNEVYMALHQAGFSLDQPSFLTTCQSFDPTRSGKFEVNDFISICIFLQSAKNLFTAFDTTKQGRISLDYNQFIYCAANLRI
ncbi:hypothetical protein KC19_1G117800 [Ceratodon purpureus]|uniref:EF-hand domain-containing protein n=1 Tax=Ceratodon purpureus TaxID=3225 RepID=A0A8T0J6S2_CERPU|nr:hypothetical protein KC19_1G117800 [Ceratodon purpureus]